MNTDPDTTPTIEADLRHEFDAVRMPGSLTFSPESVLRQGSRNLRRHRLITAGSAAMAVALVAGGSALLNAPHDTAAPQPATHAPTTGIVRTEIGLTSSGTFRIDLNRDPKVTSNVKLFFVEEDGGRRIEVAVWSTTKPGQTPGQTPGATWKSGVVDGHPFTVGLAPGKDVVVELAGDADYMILSDPAKVPGYTMFAVQYANGKDKEPARPAGIASISWTGPTGIVDGIEGDHRLTGRALNVGKDLSVVVVVRPGDGGRSIVFGRVRFQSHNFAYAKPLTVATTDPSGAAIVTGRELVVRQMPQGPNEVTEDGTPVAAGILPPGAADIGVILTTGKRAEIVLSATEPSGPMPLPDGRVVFAFTVQNEQPLQQPNTDSIEAVTWTNADGTQGRQEVTQKP